MQLALVNSNENDTVLNYRPTLTFIKSHFLVNLANMANDKLYRNCRSSGLHCSWFYAVFNSQDHHCRTVDLYSAAPSLSLQKHYTPWAIKTWHFNFVHHLRQLLTDFQNFLTTTLCKQFAYHVKPTQLNPHSLVSYRPFTVMLG